MLDDPHILTAFVDEATSILAALDDVLVALEQDPGDAGQIQWLYRSFHNLRGTCGWLALGSMESLSLATQEYVEAVRGQSQPPQASVFRLLFEVVDTLRRMVRHIEKYRKEPDEDLAALLQQLRVAVDSDAAHPPVVTEPAKPDAVHEAHASSRTLVHRDDASRDDASRDDASRDDASRDDASRDDSMRIDQSKSIRVRVDLLDHLMSLVGELVLVRNQFGQVVDRRTSREFAQLSQRLNTVTVELQESVTKTRMQPISAVWERFPRLIRDLSLELDKRISLHVQGGATELDRTLIEAILDPLTHILRNAVDHGIESPSDRVRLGKPAEGRIHLRAYHEGGYVHILVADDGRGVDLGALRLKALAAGRITQEQLQLMSEEETLNLMFESGISTADSITRVSGRGFGMDVVRHDIESIGGTIDVYNQTGNGATFKIRIPLTLAIITALIVRVDGIRYAIPQACLVELIYLKTDGETHRGVSGNQQQTPGGHRSAIEYVYDAPVYRHRGALLPLVDLRHVLQIRKKRPQGDVYIAVLDVEATSFGVIVDDILDTKEIVVKALSDELRGIGCYSGATILGDGRVALILDAQRLAERAGLTGQPHYSTDRPAPVATEPQASLRLLLFQAGHARFAIPLAEVTRIEEFERGLVERIGEREYLQYRDSILPLVHVKCLVEERRARPRGEQAPTVTDSQLMQVIVHDRDSDAVGLVVDSIVDIVDAPAAHIRPGATRQGISGTAVILGRITELLDIEQARRRVVAI